MITLKQPIDSLKVSPANTSASDTTLKASGYDLMTASAPGNDTTIEKALPQFFYTEHTEGLPLKYRIARTESWISPLLLLLFFFVAMLVTYFSKELKALFSSPFKREGIRKLNDEENFMARRTLLSLLLIFLLAWPILIYQTMVRFQLKDMLPDLMPVYLLILGITALLLIARLLLVRLTGILFYCRKEADIYSQGIMLMFGASGMLMIPLCLAAQFAEGVALDGILWAAWLLTGLAYLGGILTGVASALRSLAISGYHLFLYFCALELLPAVFIVKMVRNMTLQG